MTPSEQSSAFCDEIEAVINRFRSEFDLTLLQAVGCLELMKLHLWQQELKSMEDEDSD